MIYLIEEDVIFNSESKELYSVSGNLGNIVLSNYASKALELLILNNDTPLERSFFFQSLWGENETSASNASLNNYISEVRKAFVSQGIDKALIMTLPRYGFKLIASIEVEPKIIQQSKAPTSVNSKLRLLKLFLFGFIICLTVLALIYFRFRVGPSDIQFSFSQGTCNFYILDSPRVTVSDYKKIIKQEQIDCKKNPRDVFMTEAREYGNVYSIRLISVCDKIKGRYSNCVNVKRVFTTEPSS